MNKVKFTWRCFDLAGNAGYEKSIVFSNPSQFGLDLGTDILFHAFGKDGNCFDAVVLGLEKSHDVLTNDEEKTFDEWRDLSYTEEEANRFATFQEFLEECQRWGARGWVDPVPLLLEPEPTLPILFALYENATDGLPPEKRICLYCMHNPVGNTVSDFIAELTPYHGYKPTTARVNEVLYRLVWMS